MIEQIDLEDVKTVIKAFEDGVFVRNTERDGETNFAIRFINPLAALARLKKACDLERHGEG